MLIQEWLGGIRCAWICDRIEWLRQGKILLCQGIRTAMLSFDNQLYFEGYTLFPGQGTCHRIASSTSNCQIPLFRGNAVCSEAVSKAFTSAEKMNVELLGNGDAHVHWHTSRRAGDMKARSKWTWSSLRVPLGRNGFWRTSVSCKLEDLIARLSETLNQMNKWKDNRWKDTLSYRIISLYIGSLLQEKPATSETQTSTEENCPRRKLREVSPSGSKEQKWLTKETTIAFKVRWDCCS